MQGGHRSVPLPVGMPRRHQRETQIFDLADRPAALLAFPQPKERPPAAEFYTGSIIIVPAGAENCWQRMIDNRTGKIWDKGSVNCYDGPPAGKDQRVGMSSLWMNAIGKAFNRGGDS